MTAANPNHTSAGKPLGKAELNKRLKKEALLRTAFDLFTKKGITETSISDIVKEAGVAKGTFYLYFKDKIDLRNLLISDRAGQLFTHAYDRGKTMLTDDAPLVDKIICLADDIIDQLNADKSLLNFISKNLSWGIFKNEMVHSSDNGVDFASIFEESFRLSPIKYKNPEVMVFMLIELISSTCYSSILYNEPLPIEELKPYLFQAIRDIMHSQELPGEETTSVNEAASINETASVNEAASVSEAVPVSEAASVSETASVNETASVSETASVNESASIIETAS